MASETPETPETADTPRETGPRRPFDWGVGCFVLLLVALPFLAWYLVGVLDEGASGGGVNAPARVESRELRRLRAEFERAKEELAEARNQARNDTMPETRAGWRKLIEDKERQVAEAKARVEELESKR